MENLPKVFVIIVNHEGKETLPEALRSVFRSAYPQLEMVLVDNASGDGSLEMVRRDYPKLTVISNSHDGGFSYGANVGIKYALERGAKYVLILEDDLESSFDFISPLIQAAEKTKEAGIIGPMVCAKDGRIIFSGARANWLKLDFSSEAESFSEEISPTKHVFPGALLIRAEVFKKTGLFKEKFPVYYGETDLCFRASRFGYESFVCRESQVSFSRIFKRGEKSEFYWREVSRRIFFWNNAPFYLKPWVFLGFLIDFGKNLVFLRFGKGGEGVEKTKQKAWQDFFHAIRN